jgi:hypothetical protein
VADALTLASAQLAVAREYGFASWTRLRDEVTARTASLARQAEAFCEASIRGGTGRAARMLAATPELARYSFATAVILGDAGRVRTELGRDPGLATQADTRTRWAPLHAASASRWHRLDPARAEGPLAVARMLLDAGADPNGRTGEAGGRLDPLRCAVAGAANPLVTRLLLERGAVPGDHDLYLVGFADDNHECLRLLLFHAADVAQLARMALAAPISLNDAEGVHLLLCCCPPDGGGPPGGPAARRRRLSGGACDVGGDNISRVPVQAATGPVVSHRGPRVRMGGGFPHVAQRDPGIQRGGDKRVPQRAARRARCGPGRWHGTHSPPADGGHGRPGNDPGALLRRRTCRTPQWSTAGG